MGLDMFLYADLSPQAQVIVDAYENTTDKYKALADVLRALAKQSTFADTRVGVTEKVVLVDDILKIATELEQI
jgi:hypothetical protein